MTVKRGSVWLADLNPTRGSDALCHQMRVLDKTRLLNKLGDLNTETITSLEGIVLLTLGY